MLLNRDPSPDGLGDLSRLASSLLAPLSPSRSTIPPSITIPSPVSARTASPTPTQTNFTVTFPFPPGPLTTSTTTTFIITLSATSITTITTTTLSTNFVSTETATELSVTALPNPAATAAVAGQTSLINANNALTRTNVIISLVLGILSVLLLLLLLIFYIRHRRRSANDDESPPFTSLTPRPAPNFTSQVRAQSASAPELMPQYMRETSLSMGPRGGTPDSYSRALAATQANNSARLLASSVTSPGTPRRVEFRSLTAPVNAPEQPPMLPPLQGMNSPAFGRMPEPPRRSPPIAPTSPLSQKHVEDSTSTAHSRRTALSPEIPAIAIQSPNSESVYSVGDEFIFGHGGDDRGEGDSGSDAERERDRARKADLGTQRRGQVGADAVRHSTRASSGVFPEVEGVRAREERVGQDDVRMRENTGMEWRGRDFYHRV